MIESWLMGGVPDDVFNDWLHDQGLGPLSTLPAIRRQFRKASSGARRNRRTAYFKAISARHITEDPSYG